MECHGCRRGPECGLLVITRTFSHGWEFPAVIDWLTLAIGGEHLSAKDRAKVLGTADRILRIDPQGEVVWETSARKSIRSDSHSLTIKMGSDFVLQGSPARLQAPNNVFGSGDPSFCGALMIAWAAEKLGIDLPRNLERWRCRRLDITNNFALGRASEVRQALSYLRQSEGGRYQVRAESESVYWSPRSSLRSAKAYHKGPHLEYQIRKNQATATDDQVKAAHRILRLELSLRGQFWRERITVPWYKLSQNDLNKYFREYFGPIIGSIEVTETDNLLARLEEVAPSSGQALAAYKTWGLIKGVGVREAQASMPASTWYRHRKILFDAGLSHADLHAGNIVPFRRRHLVLEEPVESWEKLMDKDRRHSRK